MTRRKLSEETIKHLPIPDSGNRVTYFAGATIQGAKAPRGFGVRVTAAGAKAFILNYRLRGREYRHTIGAWPDWSALKAVREARNLRQRIDRGENPCGRPQAQPKTKTVPMSLTIWATRPQPERPLRSADHVESAFKRLVKPRIGKVGITHFAGPMWLKCSIGSRITPAPSWLIAPELICGKH